MKTAEEILRDIFPPPTNEAERNDDKNIIKAMEIYADQQTQELQRQKDELVEALENIVKATNESIEPELQVLDNPSKYHHMDASTARTIVSATNIFIKRIESILSTHKTN